MLETKIRVELKRESYDAHKLNVEQNRNYRQKSEYYLLKNHFKNEELYEKYKEIVPIRIITHHYTKDLLIPEINQDGSKNNFYLVLERNMIKLMNYDIKFIFEFIGYDHYINKKNKERRRITYKKNINGLYLKDALNFEYDIIETLKGVKFKNYLFKKSCMNNEMLHKINKLKFNEDESLINMYKK